MPYSFFFREAGHNSKVHTKDFFLQIHNKFSAGNLLCLLLEFARQKKIVSLYFYAHMVIAIVWYGFMFQGLSRIMDDSCGF